ncbi:hypothetical protein STENM36S_00692 [Streptomyces tendae]
MSRQTAPVPHGTAAGSLDSAWSGAGPAGLTGSSSPAGQAGRVPRSPPAVGRGAPLRSPRRGLEHPADRRHGQGGPSCHGGPGGLGPSRAGADPGPGERRAAGRRRGRPRRPGASADRAGGAGGHRPDVPLPGARDRPRGGRAGPEGRGSGGSSSCRPARCWRTRATPATGTTGRSSGPSRTAARTTFVRPDEFAGNALWKWGLHPTEGVVRAPYGQAARAVVHEADIAAGARRRPRCWSSLAGVVGLAHLGHVDDGLDGRVVDEALEAAPAAAYAMPRLQGPLDGGRRPGPRCARRRPCRARRRNRPLKPRETRSR